MVTSHALDMQLGALGDEGKGGVFIVEGEFSAVIPRWFRDCDREPNFAVQGYGKQQQPLKVTMAI